MDEKIIVIDGDNAIRCEAILSAFKPFAKVFRYNCDQERIETELADEPGVWETTNQNGTNFLIGLIHGGDREHLKKLNVQLKVYYGGVEGHDARPPAGEYQVHRSILGISDSITQEEAQALIALAKGQIDPPKFLFDPLFNPETDHLIDIFHDELLAPQKIEDWQKLKEKHQLKFKEYSEEWNQFIKKVVELKNRIGAIKQNNEEYNLLLNALIDKIFQ
ncbi:MAG: hypothetical protein DHS20C18_00240 [Saprospiraceae bacterium]|nr:MAG: hypothetical protein DHS20C18_00240 [Saprospiraceae bacterium]